MTAHSILSLLPKNSNFKVNGDILFEDENILHYKERQLLGLRGNHISMIFQEPMSALNPLHTVFKQIVKLTKRKVKNYIAKQWIDNQLRMKRVMGALTNR